MILLDCCKWLEIAVKLSVVPQGLAIRSPAVNQTSVQKKPRTLFGTRRHFIRIRHIALSEYHGDVK
jgi:hypothetical protein